MVIEAQSSLPMAALWGTGATASSDGQFFPTTRQGEAMNLINAKYGGDPGLKAYTHVSDQFAPFASQTIPATVSEAPYILDGLLNNEMGKRIKEQYADTGGFTDHVFAVTSILGHRFIPRIRDLLKTVLCFRSRRYSAQLEGDGWRQNPGGADCLKLARHIAGRRDHDRRNHRAKPDPAKTGVISASERSCRCFAS